MIDYVQKGGEYLNIQQVVHDLALEYAKAQYSEYQKTTPAEERNNLKDPYNFLTFYLSAYDVIDPQREAIKNRINRED